MVAGPSRGALLQPDNDTNATIERDHSSESSPRPVEHQVIVELSTSNAKRQHSRPRRKKAASPLEDLAASAWIQQANSFLALDLLTATEHFMEAIAPASSIGPSAIHIPPQLQQHMPLPSLGKESDHDAFPGTTGAEGLSIVAPHNSNAVLYLPVMEDSQVDQQTNNNNIISALTRSSKQGELASAVDAFPELGSSLHGSHREGKGVGGPFTAVPLEGDVISPIERPIAREDSGVVCVIPVAPWGVSLEGIETAQSTGTAAAPWDVTPMAELLQHFVQRLPQRQQKKKKHVNPLVAVEEELKKKALCRACRNSCHTKNMNASTESSLFPLHRCKTLHLVRHAQGVHNLEGDKDHKAYSSPNFFDAELTPLGWNQVDNLRKHVNTCGIAKKIELVIVSPLLRTMQTAVGAFGGESLKDGLSVPPLMVENAGNCGRLAISSLNCPPFIALEFCRERMNNPCNKRRSISEYQLLFPAIDFSLMENNEDVLWKPDVRETLSEMEARGLKFFDWIWTRKEKEIAVVTHCKFLSCTLQQFGNECHPSIRTEFTKHFANCELRSMVLVDTRAIGSDPPTSNYPGKIPHGTDLPNNSSDGKHSSYDFVG